MRIIMMFAALLVLAAGNAQAESGLPFQDFSLGPHYQTIKSDFADASSAGTMYGLDLAINGSYADTLLDGQHNRLRFGDYLGVHTTLSGANYKSSGNRYFAGLGYALGAQAGLAVSDYADIGARYYVDFRDNKFGSPNNSQSLRLNTAQLMVRLAKIYIAAGAGNGKKAQGDETFRSSTFHVRYLFADGGYAGVMMDSLKIKYELTGRNDTITNIVVQFGIAH
ncbi:MAG: hypothetical protein ACM32I_11810 [Nitrospirota bacterium]